MTVQIKRHNPYYNAFQPSQQADESPCPSPAPYRTFPEETLHAEALAAEVNFSPYPAFCPERLYTPPKETLVRLFVGQLPYNVQVEQAEWIVAEATGCQTFHTEIIHRWTAGQEPKGCVHMYCYPGDVERIQAMSKRVLVDDTGIWIAEDENQRATLHAYCAAMKVDKRLRFANRPYQTVVLEVAKSSFRPREDHSNHVPMMQHQPPQYHTAFGFCTPPPSYAETLVE